MRTLGGLVIALGACLAFPGTITAQPDPPPPQCKAPELVTAFGSYFSASITLDRTTPKPDLPIGPDGVDGATESMRLLLESIPAANAAWRLVLRDEARRVVAILGPEDFLRGQEVGPHRRWTSRLPANKIMPELLNAGPGDSVTIRAGFALPRAKPGERLFSIPANSPKWRPLYEQGDTRPKELGDIVGMMVTSGDTVIGSGPTETHERTPWCCSGVMVAPNVFMTNWHCGGRGNTSAQAYWNSDVWANTVVDLGWDSGQVRRQYNVVKRLYVSQAMDVAFLEVVPTVGAGAAIGQSNVAHVSFSDLAMNQSVFIVHHASCEAKLVSRSCGLMGSRPGWTATDPAAAPTEVAHNCATEPGASGAPVFDMSGNLVALHHLGFNQGGACQAPEKLNRAVTIKSIAHDLQQNAPELIARLGWRAAD